MEYISLCKVDLSLRSQSRVAKYVVTITVNRKAIMQSRDLNFSHDYKIVEDYYYKVWFLKIQDRQRGGKVDSYGNLNNHLSVKWHT